MTRSRIEEYTGEIFKNNKCIPGSTTYYLENTSSKESLVDKDKYTDEELMSLERYLPRSFPKKTCWGKSPKEIVDGDGWAWDEEKEVFNNKAFYDKDTKVSIDFKGVLKSWNNTLYLVPMKKEGIVDKEGLCWAYDNVSVCWSLKKNTPIDFWETRKGKRMENYIAYRKKREIRSNMLKQ